MEILGNLEMLHSCGPLMASYHMLSYVGKDFICECCCWNSSVDPLLLPTAIKGEMQYFSSVFTTKCLHGLDGINDMLGKSI